MMCTPTIGILRPWTIYQHEVEIQCHIRRYITVYCRSLKAVPGIQCFLSKVLVLNVSNITCNIREGINKNCNSSLT